MSGKSGLGRLERRFQVFRAKGKAILACSGLGRKVKYGYFGLAQQRSYKYVAVAALVLTVKGEFAVMFVLMVIIGILLVSIVVIYK